MGRKMLMGKVSSKKDYIYSRVMDEANHIILSRDTVRKTAKIFGVSKSTVHKDMTQRLPKMSKFLYDTVMEILAFNKKERHIRGGMATKLKYGGMNNANSTRITDAGA
jgi:putative DeoR family transcriptional regulator (stage III sporulation protein D)